MKGNNNLNQNIISLHSYQKNGKYKQGLYEQVMQQAEISKKEAITIRDAATQNILTIGKSVITSKIINLKRQGTSSFRYKNRALITSLKVLKIFLFIVYF